MKVPITILFQSAFKRRNILILRPTYTCKIYGPPNRTQVTHAYELHESSGFAY